MQQWCQRTFSRPLLPWRLEIRGRKALTKPKTHRNTSKGFLNNLTAVLGKQIIWQSLCHKFLAMSSAMIARLEDTKRQTDKSIGRNTWTSDENTQNTPSLPWIRPYVLKCQDLFPYVPCGYALWKRLCKRVHGKIGFLEDRLPSETARRITLIAIHVLFPPACQKWCLQTLSLLVALNRLMLYYLCFTPSTAIGLLLREGVRLGGPISPYLAYTRR